MIVKPKWGRVSDLTPTLNKIAALGWGDGLADKMLATQVWEPGFRSPEPM